MRYFGRMPAMKAACDAVIETELLRLQGLSLDDLLAKEGVISKDIVIGNYKLQIIVAIEFLVSKAKVIVEIREGKHVFSNTISSKGFFKLEDSSVEPLSESDYW